MKVINMMTIDYDALNVGLEIARWLAIVGLGVWGYLRTKDNDNASAVKHVAEELAAFIAASAKANTAQNNRITIMEETVKHLPTLRDQSNLREEVAALTANVEGLGDMLKRVDHQTQLIHTHLLSTK